MTLIRERPYQSVLTTMSGDEALHRTHEEKAKRGALLVYGFRDSDAGLGMAVPEAR